MQQRFATPLAVSRTVSRGHQGILGQVGCDQANPLPSVIGDAITFKSQAPQR
jgi:hypothetical protein